MRSLLARIFLSFWSIIVITIVAAGSLGYVYAERVRASLESFEVSDAMLAASASLRENGREGLEDWLRSIPDINASRIYIIDEGGRDLLDRAVPPPIELAMRRFVERRTRWTRQRRDVGNLRPARPFTQLIGPEDDVYTLFVLPPQGVVGRWLAERGGAVVVLLALLVSALVSFLLARAISRPIRRFRESAIAIAGGNLDVRVTDQVGSRRDEIGLLAADFDRMADELKRAWTRQTELTQNVSHELRSPLARLSVALELARRKAGDLTEFERIDLETARLDQLIGQILEFSRLDADPHEDRVRINLGELLEAIIEDVRYEYGEEISLSAEGDIEIEGYPGALGSGLENVLRNAMQHGRGDGGVAVALAETDSGAEITVLDHGGGIDPDELDSIFDPFFRSAANQPGTGSGLGLAIAKRAIEQNGGTVAASNADSGLRIEIRLPELSGN